VDKGGDRVDGVCPMARLVDALECAVHAVFLEESALFRAPALIHLTPTCGHQVSSEYHLRLGMSSGSVDSILLTPEGCMTGIMPWTVGTVVSSQCFWRVNAQGPAGPAQRRARSDGREAMVTGPAQVLASTAKIPPTRDKLAHRGLTVVLDGHRIPLELRVLWTAALAPMGRYSG
jgi:hypothetical protein